MSEYISSDLRILVVNDIYTRKTSLVPTLDVLDTCNLMVNVPSSYREMIHKASVSEDGPVAQPIGGFLSLPSAVEYLVRENADECVLGELSTPALQVLAKELGLQDSAELSADACKLYLDQSLGGNASYLFVNGDLLGGSQLANVYKGLSVVSIMNHTAPTMVALGNHEFDHNNVGLEKCIKHSAFPWLGENIRWEEPKRPLRGVGSCIIYDNVIDKYGKCIAKYRNVNMELLVSLLVRGEVDSVDASVDQYGEYMHLVDGAMEGKEASFQKSVQNQGHREPTEGHCSFVPYLQDPDSSPLASLLKNIDQANHLFAKQVLNEHLSNNTNEKTDSDSEEFYIMRLGMFTVCTPFTPSLAYPSAGTVFYDSISCAEILAKALRSVECHYVVCSSHLSVNEDLILSTMEKQYREKSSYLGLKSQVRCANTPEWVDNLSTTADSKNTLIDIILGGHEHVPIITQPTGIQQPPSLISPMHSMNDQDTYLQDTYTERDLEDVQSNSVTLHPKNVPYDARNGALILKCGQNAQYVAVVDLQFGFETTKNVYNDMQIIDQLSTNGTTSHISTFTPSLSQSAFAPLFPRILYTDNLRERLHDATHKFPILDTLRKFNCILKSQYTRVLDPVVVLRENIPEVQNSNSVPQDDNTAQYPMIRTVCNVTDIAKNSNDNKSMLPPPALFFQGHIALDGTAFCAAYLRTLLQSYKQHENTRYNNKIQCKVRFIGRIQSRFTVRFVANQSETKIANGMYNDESAYMKPCKVAKVNNTVLDNNIQKRLHMKDSAALVLKTTYFPAHQNTNNVINYFLSRMYTDQPLKVSLTEVLVKLSGPLDTRSEFTRIRGTSGGNQLADAFEFWTEKWQPLPVDSNSNPAPIAGNPFDSNISRSCNEPTWKTQHREQQLKADPVAQLTLINGGFIRGDTLYPRETPVTYDLILEELPFPKVLVFAKIQGRDLIDAINEELFKFPKPAGSFPHFSRNVRVLFTETESPLDALVFPVWEHKDNVTTTSTNIPTIEEGSSYISTKRVPRKVSSMTIDNISVQPDAVYLLTTTQFIAWGGDGCVSFLKAQFVTHQEPFKNGVIVSSVVYEYLLHIRDAWKKNNADNNNNNNNIARYKPPFEDRIKLLK